MLLPPHCLHWGSTKRWTVRHPPCTHADDTLLAFLDDLYIVTTPARVREAFDTAAHAVEDQCGIASNLGKTRVLAAEGGPPPPRITELGEDVWCGDKPPAQRGVVVLGTPVGHPDFVQAWTDKRLCEERRLLEELPHLPVISSSSARGCSFCFARRLAQTTPCAHSRLRKPRRTHADTTRLSGTLSSNAWAEWRRLMQRTLGRSPPSRPSTAGSVCSRPLPRGSRAGKHRWAGLLPARGSFGTQPPAGGRLGQLPHVAHRLRRRPPTTPH